MFVMDIAVILDKKLIKKWFIIKEVDDILKKNIEKLMENCYTIVKPRDDVFGFINFIKSNGINAFFEKMKRNYSLEEVSLKDLVNNYSRDELMNDYSIIIDVDNTKDTSFSEDIYEIIEEFEEEDIDFSTAINELKKLGLDIPVFTEGSLTFNPNGKNVYAIDCSLDLDQEYHSFFMLFESKEKAFQFKKFFRKGDIGESIFRYSTFNYLMSLLYGETNCVLKDLPSYKGRITLITSPIYFGEDEF